MDADPSLRLFVQQVYERADSHHQGLASRLRSRLHPGESLASAIVGLACVALAAVVASATLLAALGLPLSPWTETHVVPNEDLSSGRQYRENEDWTRLDILPVVVGSRVIYWPSATCRLLALSGAALGGIGLILGLRRGRLAWLSALGFSVITLMMLVNLVRQVILPSG
jgi:hypothetical protein